MGLLITDVAPTAAEVQNDLRGQLRTERTLRYWLWATDICMLDGTPWVV
jgi:hypothetical protein